MILDTGSPLSWLPERIWSQFQDGVDYVWLSYPQGYRAPTGRVVGWSFTFRVARMLAPVILLDSATEYPRPDVIFLFADGNPPVPPGSNAPPYVMMGLWGGLLDGTKLAVTPNPGTGGVDGTLEF